MKWVVGWDCISLSPFPKWNYCFESRAFFLEGCYLSQSVSTTGVGCFVNLSCRLELVATLTWLKLNIAKIAFPTYIVLCVIKSMGREEKVVKTVPVQ